MKTPGSGEDGQTPGRAYNHLISRDLQQLSPETPLPQLLTVQRHPLNTCCTLLPLDCDIGSCTGTLGLTGQAKIPRVQHLGKRQWKNPKRALLHPSSVGFLTQEIVPSLDPGKWQGSVDTSLASSPVSPGCRVKRPYPLVAASCLLTQSRNRKWLCQPKETGLLFRTCVSLAPSLSPRPLVSLTETGLLINGTDTMNLKAPRQV